MKYTQRLILVVLAAIGTSSAAGLRAEPTAPSGPTRVPVDSFVVPEGMEVTVWATSPMLRNPTNMDIDHLGRVWVAQGVNYRMFRNSDVYPEDPAGDSIVVLTDSDGDGVADKSHVFVQEPELVAPLGVAVIDNKVVVSQPPSLIVYTDVDRDAVFDPQVDTREILLEGFGGRDHDHSLHAVTTGPSGQWYFNTGNAGTHVVTDREGTTVRVGSAYKGGAPSVTDEGPNQGGQPGLVSDDGHVYVGSVALRVNPDGTGLRVIGHNMRNSYEECVNSFGDVFQNDNDDPPACRTTWLMEYGNLGFASDDGSRKWQAERRPGQPAAIAEWRQEDPGTIPAGDVYGNGSPTGIAFYENGSLGEKWRGLLLSCEAARNVVFGYFPKPAGAGFELERFDFLRSRRGGEFPQGEEHKAGLASWFRPSDVTVGPDGAVYVADWFDSGVGGHRMSDKAAAGTIYRIAPKGFKSVPPALDLATEKGQVAALRSPANNVRNIGFTRLKAAGDTAYPAVRALLGDPDPFLRARALWLLAQLGDRGIAAVEQVLADGGQDPQLRVAAFRALRFAGSKVLARAAAYASDSSPALRREVALALRDVPVEQCRPILVELAAGYDGEDRWYLEALGTGSMGKEVAIYDALLKQSPDRDPVNWNPTFADIAWRLHPNASANAFKARALSSDLPIDQRKRALTALAFIPTKGAALAMVAVAESGPQDTRPLASWWLHNRGGNDWAAHADLMKGLNRVPNALKPNQDYLSPALAIDLASTFDVADVMALEGDPVKGKLAITRCIMCHQVDGAGVDFGPALDGWGEGRPSEVIAGAIIHPSREIAHGFDGTEVVTKDGHTLQGFVLFDGGSMILRVNGGGEVTIPRQEIAARSSLEKSLMMSAAQLGMTAQDVADIVAYMKDGVLAREAGVSATVEAAPPVAAKLVTLPVAKPAANKAALELDHVAARDLTNAPSINWGDTTGRKRILFLAGSTTHRHGIHEYKAGSILLADALNASGLPVVAKVHWYGWPEDDTIFDGIDACILYADAGGAFTEEQYAFLDGKVKQGMAIMFLHYGVHPTKEIGEKFYKPWVGGYYADAFSVNPSWIADLAPKADHPVARGIAAPVRVYDELYWNMEIDRDNPEVFALATAVPTDKNMVRYGSSKFWNRLAADKLGTAQEIIWCRDPADGGARGAGFVGGHYHRNWAIDDYRKVILNSIAWLARLEVPQGGVPSQPVTRAMLNENLIRPQWPEEIDLPTSDLLEQPAGTAPELGPDGRVPPRNTKRP
jgi:putative membrane-bound dehydrogenase-like protein